MMDIEEMRNHEWIVSWSGGKDSTSTILKMIEYNIPIKKIIYVRMMYTETIPATLPIVTNFVDNAVNRFKCMGFDVDVVQSKPLFDYVIAKFKRSKNKDKNGKTYGMCAFIRGHCIGTREKQLTIKKLTKQYENDYEMIGYACDETTRIHRLGDKKQSILVELGITENECFEICSKEHLLSPLYEIGFKRDGCWFCPNVPKQQRTYIKAYCPDIYKLIREQYELTNFDMSKRNNWYKEIKAEEENKQLSIFDGE